MISDLRWWLSGAPDDPEHVALLERPTVRVDGEARCERCGRPYDAHPTLRVRGFETFLVGCDDELLKL